MNSDKTTDSSLSTSSDQRIQKQDREYEDITLSRTAIVLLTAFLCGTTIGIVYAGSYLINPVQKACPSWSDSAPVYGQAGTLATTAFFGILFSRRIQIHPPGLFLLCSIVSFAMSFGVCGIAVSFCNNTSHNLQVVYILSYSFIGLSVVTTSMPVIDCSLAWMRRRPGRACSTISIGVASGSIAFCQIFIKLQRLCDSGVLDAGTMFFLIGILFVVFEIPLLLFVTHPLKSRRKAPVIQQSSTDIDNYSVEKRVYATKTFWVLVVIRFLSFLPGFALVDRQQQLFEAIWKSSSQPPYEVLAFLAQLSFLAATITSFAISDWLRPTRMWIFVLALETVCLGLLPWFLQVSSAWGQYAALVSYFVFNGAFYVPKALAGAIALEYFGPKQGTEALGLLQLGYGGAGLVGPIVLEAMYYHFNQTYQNFLYLSASMSFVSLIGIILSQPSNVS